MKSIPESNTTFRGHFSAGRPAKWLDEESGQLPPVAFVVPVTDADLDIIQTSPDGEPGKAFVREWATTEFLARYVCELPRLEDEIRIADDQIGDVERQIAKHRVHRDRTPQRLITSKRAVDFPSGFLGRWLIFVGVMLCSQILLEWWNGSTFTLFELQDRLAGLGFTYCLALAPFALKLFWEESSFWKKLGFTALWCAALFCFLHVFTDVYLTSDPSLSADQLLDQIGQAPAAAPRFWEDPLNSRWRFMWQVILTSLVGFAFSNHIARHVHVTTTTYEKDNPACVWIESQLTTLTLQRESWGKRRAEAEGIRREWEASLERHVLRSLSLFEEEESRRRDEQALENLLKQKIERRNNRLYSHRN